MKKYFSFFIVYALATTFASALTMMDSGNYDPDTAGDESAVMNVDPVPNADEYQQQMQEEEFMRQEEAEWNSPEYMGSEEYIEPGAYDSEVEYYDD